MSLTALKTPSSPQASLSITGSDKPVQLYKALGEGIRLRILRLLKSESFGVLELCSILDIKQSGLSHHLKILANAGLVATRREGNSIFYRRAFLADSDLFITIKHAVFAQLDNTPLDKELIRKIKRIQLERSQLSLSFFNRNSDKFRKNQELITQLHEYETNIFELIASIEGLAVADQPSIMEVGPGEGQLLEKLASRFENLIALDNSAEMLTLAENTVGAAGHSHVQFVLGDTAVAIKQNLRCDLLLLSMVLHHISSPAKTFSDTASILNPGGSMLVIDLCNHDQDWVRESCGDLWLGFESEALSDWARQAGLQEGQSLYLGLRNGFQIQMRLFHKPN